MYHNIASKITNFFIRGKIIDAEKEDLYLYGFEIMISSIGYLIVFLLASFISQTVVTSILFWLGLFLIRKTAGGHHANSYTSCHLLFLANHLVFIIIFKVTPLSVYNWSTIAILLLCAILIFSLAPVDHKNKPFINGEYKRYRCLSVIYSCILICVSTLVLFRVITANNFLFSFSIGTLSATISLLFGKIIRNKERKIENEKAF